MTVRVHVRVLIGMDSSKRLRISLDGVTRMVRDGVDGHRVPHVQRKAEVSAIC